MTRLPAAIVALAVVTAACTSGAILANPMPAGPVVTPAPTPTAPPPDPRPLVLPADDAPHERLTEWWYYTGHLRDDAGGRWGFEYVIFRAERGGFPVTWASHLALTDETGGTFRYAQRSEIGPQVDVGAGAAGAAGGFALAISGFDPTADALIAREPWTMAGSDGTDRLHAAAAMDEVAGLSARAAFTLDLRLRATKPPALHNRIGWIDFGPAGGSYYYSRTAMTATGSLGVDDRTLRVDGSAWFDHQWGDFIAIGGGGWDWFAVNLDDGTDLTLSLVRNADGSYPLVYGTLVEPDGEARHLDRDAFAVEVIDRWQSPRTGADYPAGWRIAVPSDSLEIRLAPTVADQELDTRATTGVVYWEGSQVVRATRDGRSLGGEAYVELTGYAPGDPGSRQP
ncbi:MAG TPA: lipocalin family protein [Candidatus Limnocylindrales bacterium]|nr:lipocalin family protein [Candidatus Limnocylindrales bacterium]